MGKPIVVCTIRNGHFSAACFPEAEVALVDWDELDSLAEDSLDWPCDHKKAIAAANKIISRLEGLSLPHPPHVALQVMELKDYIRKVEAARYAKRKGKKDQRKFRRTKEYREYVKFQFGKGPAKGKRKPK